MHCWDYMSHLGYVLTSWGKDAEERNMGTGGFQSSVLEECPEHRSQDTSTMCCVQFCIHCVDDSIC